VGGNLLGMLSVINSDRDSGGTRHSDQDGVATNLQQAALATAKPAHTATDGASSVLRRATATTTTGMDGCSMAEKTEC
jgi:hypothetical protein